MNLYELNKMYGEALSLAINNDGEIVDDSLVSLLDEIQEAKETKLLNIGCMIKNLEANSEAIANEIKRLQDRKKSIDRKVDSLSSYLASNLDGKLSDPRVELSFRKSKSVELDIDIEYFAKQNPHFVRTKYEANKTMIRNALDDGAHIIGASIVEKNNLVIK